MLGGHGGASYVTTGMSETIVGVTTTLTLTGSTRVAHSAEHLNCGKSVIMTLSSADATSGTFLTAVGSPVPLTPMTSSGFGITNGPEGLAVSLSSTSFIAAKLREETSKTALNDSCEVLSVPGAIK